MGQAVLTLADFKVNPSIAVQTCEFVFVDELVGDVWSLMQMYLGLGMGVSR